MINLPTRVKFTLPTINELISRTNKQAIFKNYVIRHLILYIRYFIIIHRKNRDSFIIFMNELEFVVRISHLFHERRSLRKKKE